MRVNRREFVKRSAFAAGGLYLFSDFSWAQAQNAAPRHGSGKRIVILGAGLAGLAAGWELKIAGHDVTILEAQLHPGGRVHTIREGLSDDLYAEAGAGRIPSTHSVTLEWVKHFGLELEPFYPKDLAQVALLKGKRVKIPADKPVDMSLVPLDLTPEERRIGFENLEDHITARDFLRQKGASEDAIPLFGCLASTTMQLLTSSTLW